MNKFEEVSNKTMNCPDSGEMRENAIYWIQGDTQCTVNLMQGRYISRIRKLAEQYPDEVTIESDKNGILIATFPVKYINISNRKRELTEEQRGILSERMSRLHADNIL